MENFKVDKQHEIEYFKKRLDEAKRGLVFAIRMFDYLIIAISIVGLWVIFQISSYSFEHKIGALYILKISGIAFIKCIFINLLSQYTSYFANRYDTVYNYRSIDKLFYETEDRSRIDEVEKKSDRFSLYTHFLNWMALISLFIGIISLCSFICVAF